MNWLQFLLYCFNNSWDDIELLSCYYWVWKLFKQRLRSNYSLDSLVIHVAPRWAVKLILHLRIVHEVQAFLHAVLHVAVVFELCQQVRLDGVRHQLLVVLPMRVLLVIVDDAIVVHVVVFVCNIVVVVLMPCTAVLRLMRWRCHGLCDDSC